MLIAIFAQEEQSSKARTCSIVFPEQPRILLPYIAVDGTRNPAPFSEVYVLFSQHSDGHPLHSLKLHWEKNDPIQLQKTTLPRVLATTLLPQHANKPEGWQPVENFLSFIGPLLKIIEEFFQHDLIKYYTSTEQSAFTHYTLPLGDPNQISTDYPSRVGQGHLCLPTSPTFRDPYIMKHFSERDIPDWMTHDSETKHLQGILEIPDFASTQAGKIQTLVTANFSKITLSFNPAAVLAAQMTR